MPKPLTILHLVSLMGMGGRCATALRQIRLLQARGHTVVLGGLKNSAAAERCRAMGVTVCDDFRFRRGFRPLEFRHDCALLKKICREHKVDIVHAHLSQESWVACLGAKWCSPRPVVIRSRGVVVPVKPHAFNRWQHNSLTARVIAPSTVICEKLRVLPGFDSKRIALIEDGVDTQRFSPNTDGAAIRAEFHIAADAPLIVMVARLERVKGHEIFFKALAKLAASAPAVRAICACDERTVGEFDKIVRRARELGCGENLLAFTGMRGDVEKIIAAADMIALPSLGSEGSSRVALEAGACGKPVVASAVGCLPEVILDGKTGLIVPSGDPDALAAALYSLVKDPARAKALGAAARTRVEELYDEKRMVERLEQIYSESVGAHSRT